jgi:Fe-S-cluster containining protein
MMGKLAEACHDLITQGICKAECCGPIPFARKFVDKHFDKITVTFEDITPGEKEFAFLITDDVMCVFLDRDTYHCKVYAERPDVCIKFGDETHPQMRCPWLRVDGTKRGRAERRAIVRETSEGQEMLFGHLSSLRDNTDWRW